MSNLHVKYLLVGGGVASSAAAGAIRDRDADGSVLLIAQEINRPYRRGPLAGAYLRHEVARDELFTREAAWFEHNHVTLRTGRRVSHLDTPRQAAILDSGEEVSYDKLLLATGAAPRPLDAPGAGLPNVLYLRTIDDADRLNKAIDKAKREGRAHDGGRGRACVVGAGLLAVELASTLAQLGVAVDLVLERGWPLEQTAGEEVGRLLSSALQGRGVNVLASVPLRRLEGDGRVQRVVLEDGRTLPCDFVAGATGMVANKDLLRGTPVGAGKAILVDAGCRTSVPGVFAAGDCAAVFDPRFGKHRLTDAWDNAAMTGAIAGRNMAGASDALDDVDTFLARAFDVTVRGWGEARLVTRRILRGAPDGGPGFAEFGVAADGRIAQALAVGVAPDADVLGEFVARRVPADPIEPSLRDPAVRLEGLLG
jgi:3-phenylpropionate/trans-cinnamate dioxygenase ferredoxin reductase subunit